MNTAYLNLIANAGKAGVTRMGLKDELGAELTGGDPAHVRVSLPWGTTENGDFEIPAGELPLEFNVPGGKTVKFVSMHSAATGGTEYDSKEVPEETFNQQGIYQVGAASISHNAA